MEGVAAKQTGRGESRDSPNTRDTRIHYEDILGNGEFLDLGSFKDSHQNPFKLTLSKETLNTDVTFPILVEGQISTGFTWIPLEVLTRQSYSSIDTAYPEFYKGKLSDDEIKERGLKGTSGHGILVSHFSDHQATHDKTSSQVAVGRKGLMKATVSISKEIVPGEYYIVLAYGRTFGSTPLATFKTVLVDIV